MAKQDAYSMFMEFLRELGYEVEGSDCGDETALIVFLHNNRPFCIIITKNDEQLFEMVCSFETIDPGNAEQVAHALDVCVTISRESKVVKAYLREEMLIAAVEMFCSPPSQVKAVFPRCLQTLADAAASSEAKMKMRPAGGSTTSFIMGLASSIPAPVISDLMRRGLVQSPVAAGHRPGQWQRALALLKKRDPKTRR